MGVLIEMNRSGHSEVKWSPEDKAAVEAAQARFNQLLANGHIAYTMKGTGESGEKKGEQTKKFDPAAEEIVTHPRLIGG